MIVNKMKYVQSVQGMEQGPWKSETVPDDTLSIKEIFIRFARNQPLGGSDLASRANYSDGEKASLDDPDMMELARMDLTDKHEYLETLKEGIEGKKKAIKDAQAALSRKQAAAAAVTADLKDFEKKEAEKQSDPKKVVKKPVKTRPEGWENDPILKD